MAGYPKNWNECIPNQTVTETETYGNSRRPLLFLLMCIIHLHKPLTSINNEHAIGYAVLINIVHIAIASNH